MILCQRCKVQAAAGKKVSKATCSKCQVTKCEHRLSFRNPDVICTGCHCGVLTYSGTRHE